MDETGSIIILASAGVGYAKSAVDMYRMANPTAPSWHKPALAIVTGVLALLLLVIASKQLLAEYPVASTLATVLLAGWLVGASASGVTAISRSARTIEDQQARILKPRTAMIENDPTDRRAA